MGRIDNFEGTPGQYTEYLEKKIGHLQQENALLCYHSKQLWVHHYQCQSNSAIQRALTTVPLPCESITQHSSHFSSPSQPLSQTPPPEIDSVPRNDRASPFILWNPAESYRSPKQSQDFRWRQEANVLISMTPNGDEWWQHLHNIGITTKEKWSKGLEFLLQTKVTVAAPLSSPMIPAVCCDSIECNRCSNEKYQVPIRCTQAYAQSYQARQQAASFFSTLVNYQQLILVSICIVLRHQGLCDTTVDNLMRIAITPAGSRYLKRLERAVKWVISLIDELKDSWGYRASELPVIWQKPPSYYVRLAENPEDSRKYLNEALRSHNFTQGFTSKSWTPYLIPIIVDRVLCGSIPLTEIAEALSTKDKDPTLFDTDGTVILQHPWHVYRVQE